MAADDGAMRERLVEDGSLFDGYNPLMAIVHRRNGDRLGEMVDAYGWPGAPMVGEDGADAAWLVLHHAIGDPALQRRCLPLLEAGGRAGRDPGLASGHAARRHPLLRGAPAGLRKHVRLGRVGRAWCRGRSRTPSGVDERRASVGLPPLADQVASARAAAEREGDHRPADPAARRDEAERWARSVGWRD